MRWRLAKRSGAFKRGREGPTTLGGWSLGSAEIGHVGFDDRVEGIAEVGGGIEHGVCVISRGVVNDGEVEVVHVVDLRIGRGSGSSPITSSCRVQRVHASMRANLVNYPGPAQRIAALHSWVAYGP